MQSYVALVYKDADSDFGVSFPDLPGCVTAGASIAEAREQAEEALALHLQGLAEDGEAFPEPSSFDAIMAERENRDAVAILVSMPKTAARAVRVSVTIPEDVLAEIDSHAERNGFTRSGFLQAAARQAIERAEKDGVAA